MSEQFDGDWLALREGFDAAARNVGLAEQFAAALPASPRLVDLGAGTGSMFRWLAPLIGRPQTWTLIDADAGLLQRALMDTAEWGAAHGMQPMLGQNTLLLLTSAGMWRIDIRQADLAMPEALPLDADGVVCSALLDLVSTRWLERLAARIEVPVLACMNVDGRDAFLPVHVDDAVVRAGFRRDQGRDKGLGPAVGPGAPAALRRAFKACGFKVMSAASDWRIPPGALEMVMEMLRGHADVAARRMPASRGVIREWQRVRTAQALRGGLAVRIGHRDILALPRGK